MPFDIAAHGGNGSGGCGNGRSLELVSKESFQQRLVGMSTTTSQDHNMAEHTRIDRENSGGVSGSGNGDRLQRTHQKVKRAKKNSPILVSLKDSIKAGAGSRRRLRTTSIASVPDILENTTAVSKSERSTNLSACKKESTVTGLCDRPPASPKSGRGTKNYNAFLSAIEKVHSKGPQVQLNMAQNLDHSSKPSDKDKSVREQEPVLNNISRLSEDLSPLESTSLGFTDRENIEIICNDLHGAGNKVRRSVTMVDDSDVSENSSVKSSWDSPCDSDAFEPEPAEEEKADVHPMSKEELSSKLSEQVNGVSFKHYEMPPSECPECLAAAFAYTHYYAQGSKYFKIEVLDRMDSGVYCDGNQSSASSASPVKSSDTVFNFPSPKRSSTKEKGKASGSSRTSHLPKSTTGHRHIDTVSLDLTGSDITFTVEQHSTAGDIPTSAGGIGSGQKRMPSSSQTYPDMYRNLYTMFGFVPCFPGYCFIPMYYFMFPTWSIPKQPSFPMRSPKSKSHSTSSDQGPGSARSTQLTVTPPLRPWIPVQQPDSCQPVAIFTVMCYNVLCDKYATRQLYSYCPSWALNWEHRKRNILNEILQYGADIVSLQEVETEQFFQFFLPELKAQGYEGIFSPKSRARTMVEADRKHVDGCAIFFRHSKFTLVKEHLVEFNRLAIETAQGSHDMINRVMTKDNIGLAALLETKGSIWENGQPPDESVRQLLLVATCHIHWDPEFCDVKLIQTMMLMNKLKDIVKESQINALAEMNSTNSDDTHSIPLILCGDLNSLPDSGVVEYLSSGYLSANHRDFKDIGYEDSLRKLSVSGRKDTYSHAFNLASAYTTEIMPYTNYTCDFQGTIDYVFYTCDLIRPLGILGSLDPDWFVENQVVGCPNPQIPSDHLPLLVEFEMYPTTSVSRQQLHDAKTLSQRAYNNS